MEVTALDTPWNIYPRPQMKRNSFFSLNGEWELAFSPLHEIPKEFPLRIGSNARKRFVNVVTVNVRITAFIITAYDTRNVRSV